MDAGQLDWSKKASESTHSAPTLGRPKAGAVSYLTQLDGVRFIAVALVLIDHWMAERNTLLLGPLGVTIFFVLSGFLITRILITSKEKLANQPNGLGRYLKTFYIRRTLRIFPLYYLVIFLLALANIPPVRDTIGWCLTYTTNIYIAYYQTWMGVIDHFWSLAVEEQVYLIFPLLLFFVPRRYVPATMILLIVGSVGFRYLVHARNYPWVVNYVATPACMDSFGLGALLAYLWLYKKDWLQRLFQHSGGVVVALLLWGGVGYLAKTYTETHNIMTDVWDRLAGSIFGFFLIGRAAVGFKGWMKWFLENPVSSYLGRISYGLYIYHNLVFNEYHTPATHPTIRIWNKLATLAPTLNDYFALKFFYLVGLTIAVSSLSWFLLEKPINSLKDRFSY